MINKKHILLHLQDAKRHLKIKDLAQVEHNIFEIANHLGFTDRQVLNLWECKERCITYCLTGKKVCKDCPIK